MKGKMKQALIAGIAAAILLIIVGAIVLGKDLKQEETNPEKSEISVEEAEKLLDQAYNKTIHDFPGHLIDNLDEQEDTNFVVYAEGVKRVTTDGESNVILQVDVEKLQYMISHPDEQITSLQEGDVFFMDPSESYALGISVKVESMDVQEDQVIITSDELTMDELIEYADVDMVLSPDEIFVNSTEDDADITVDVEDDWKLDISDETLRSMMDELQAGERLWEKEEEENAGGATAGGSDGNEGMTDFHGNIGGSAMGNTEGSVLDWMEDMYDTISKTSEFDVRDVYLDGSIGFRHGVFSAKGSARYKSSGAHVIFQYSPGVTIWKFGYFSDMSISAKINLEGKLTGNWAMLPVQTAIVPVAGPIMVTYHYQPTIDASVSLGMSVGGSSTCHVDTIAYVVNGIPMFRDCSVAVLESETNYSFAEINGRLAWNMLDASAELGVPLVGGIKVGMKGGLEVKGTLQKNEWTGDRGESVHDCEACVKGDSNTFVRADISVDVAKLLGKKTDTYKTTKEDTENDSNNKTDTNKESDSEKEINLGNLTWTFFDRKFPLESPYNEFYISFQEDKEAEFDYGKCPHRRWRTDVTVLKEGSKEPMPEMIIEVYQADGEQRYEVSDENGKFTTYLPNGDNLLQAEDDDSHLRGKAHAVIEDKPIEVELLLGSGNVHVIFADHEQDPVIDDHDTDSWYELQEKLINMYPEAQWYHDYRRDELFANGSVSQGDFILDVTYDAPHTSYGQWNDDYLEDGDNSNIWGEGGGWIYAEISRVCKDQNSGELIPKYTFGISVSYDPARKAYLRNPQPAFAPYIIKITQDVSGIFNDEYLLIGYGAREDGRETWTQEEKRIQTDYRYDTDAVRGGSYERHHLAGLMVEYLKPFMDAMMDQWDLDQIMVHWE